MKRSLCCLLALCLAAALLWGCAAGEGGSAPAWSDAWTSAGSGDPPAEEPGPEGAETPEEPEEPEPPGEPEGYVSWYDGSLGSAGTLEGTVLILSIFTDDGSTRWDPSSETDRAVMEDTLDYLRIAADYLTRQAARYGSEVTFVYDWAEEPELRMEASFTEELVRYDGEMYGTQVEWLRENADARRLQSEHLADHVIYFFFFNTDYSNQVNPWSVGYSNFGGMPDAGFIYEITNLYVKYDDCFTTSASSYAHEMMHAFGAHDLYYANEFITQEYVDHCADVGSNDIMYAVSDGKEIFSDFTDLDAYYVGLIDRCEEAEQWGLAPSEH